MSGDSQHNCNRCVSGNSQLIMKLVYVWCQPTYCNRCMSGDSQPNLIDVCMVTANIIIFVVCLVTANSLFSVYVW